ncbi:MAG: S8 family peptidase, partial [Thermaurantiacus sp.]
MFDTPEYRRSDAAVASNVLPAWAEGASGAGVIVGLLDSGIASGNPEFAGRIHASSRDVTGNGRPITDEGGHGTSVAGVMAAARDNSGIVGIAPQVTLAVYRADRPGTCGTDDGCRYNDSALAAGIDAAIAVGARAINISLGGTGASPVLRDAFVRAGQAGVVLVLSAGNDSRSEVNGLALSALQSAGGATVVVVGSVGTTRQLSEFSNQAGQAATNYVVALGERVRSFNQNGQAFLYSGTSYSAPQVTGAIALLAQAFPQLSPQQLVRLVLESADDAGIAGTDNIYGRGVLNIGRAFQPIGQTSLAATATPVSQSSNGHLGAPMGGGEGFGTSLGLVPISDSFGRVFALPVARTLRPYTPARLGRALGLDTSWAPPVQAGVGTLLLSARSGTAVPTADAFRWSQSAESHLGLAQRGVSAQRLAAPRSLSGQLLAGPLVFGLVEGPGAVLALPGESPFPRLVAADGLDPAADLAARTIQAAGAEISAGRLRLGLAVEHGRAAAIPGRRYERLSERRMTASAGLSVGALDLAIRAATVGSEGAFLGTRGGPALGVLGGAGREAGASIGVDLGGLRMRAAGALGWHRPRLSGFGLLQPGEGEI